MIKLRKEFKELTKRFNMEELKQMDILLLLRLIDKIDEVDDEVHASLKELQTVLKDLSIDNRDAFKTYMKQYKDSIKLLKRKHPVEHNELKDNGSK